MMRIDYIFSYWIFFWYLLYVFGLVKYNPKFAIVCGVVENIIIVVLMFLYNTQKKLVLLFAMMFVLLKVIPLYTIWNTKINNTDIIATFALFSIYLVWTLLNNKTPRDFHKQTQDLIFHNKNTLPGMSVLQKLMNF